VNRIWVLHSRSVSSRAFKWRNMNRRIGFLVGFGGGRILTVNGAFSKPSPQAARKVIKLFWRARAGAI